MPSLSLNVLIEDLPFSWLWFVISQDLSIHGAVGRVGRGRALYSYKTQGTPIILFGPENKSKNCGLVFSLCTR